MAAIIGRYWIVGYYIGELAVPDSVIQKQRADHNILIGMAYNEQGRYLKLQNANYYQADVMALGTSRVMQFQADFFSSDFYNAGGAVSGNYDEYINFLENLNYIPEVIILGLDLWVFNDSWNSYACIDYTNYKNIEVLERDSHSIIKDIKTDYSKGKWKYGELNNYPENFGMNGRVKDNGFLYDGSYYYGDTYRNPERQDDYHFKSTFWRIETGSNRFEYGEHIDDETICLLGDFLEYCKNKDIMVVGVLCPLAPGVYDKMDALGMYGYMYEIAPICKKYFDKYDYEFYDYLNGGNLGLSDDYFVDGFHGSSIAYAYIIKNMIEKDSILDDYVNIDKLNALLENRYSNLCFYNPDR